MSMTRPNLQRLGPSAGDRVVIIGGCGGLGFDFCQTGVAQGLSVAVLDTAAAIARREMPESVPCAPIDLCDDGSIALGLDALPPDFATFHHLLLASGFTAALAPLRTVDKDAFHQTMHGNFSGPALAIGAALPQMVEGGSIVVLSTAIGQLGAPGYAAYGAAKSALNAIVRTVATEEAPGLRINGIAPGAVDTAFIRGGYHNGGAEDGTPSRFDLDAYEAKVPLGRIATAADITGPILFLMSEAARYVTGQVLHVNGGAFMRD